jgi:hypothetical protein
MAGPLLSGDKQISRRRWFIVAAVFTLVVLLFTATSHYRPLRPHDLEHSSPRPSQTSSPAPAPTNSAKTVPVTQFKKPKDIPIVAMIFFGRKSRVELLRCYLEVRSCSGALRLERANLLSAIWLTTAAGSTRSIGYGIPRRQMIWHI